MTQGLEITLAPERLSEGSPEERAAFGLFAIGSGNVALTEGYDSFIDALRPGPLVSGYHAAEWFAANWWRLRYEPYSPRSADWWRAHRMTAIGEGYVWPNIVFRTDGARSAILSEPSSDPQAKPFRYLGANPWLGPSVAVEEAIDNFLMRIVGRLAERGIRESNLNRLWTEVLTERQDSDQAERRRLEALMGFDPDEADERFIQTLLDDRQRFGSAAVDELAAETAGTSPLTSERLLSIAAREGAMIKRSDAMTLSADVLAETCSRPLAWQQGQHAARMLRKQENLGDAPIETARLAEMIGGTGIGPGRGQPTSPISFLFPERSVNASMVLRSRWETGRRFELARLLGDHLRFGQTDHLLPATGAYTFRQQAQRTFAAELLSPLNVVTDMLQGDYSPEAIEDTARHFKVSTMTVDNLLRNNNVYEAA